MTHVLPGVELPPLPSGPTPTLIEYSGYGYADPAGPESGISLLANLMGFTVVDVNMRGTGCSGGAFDFFEPLQSLDGYDVVETISHQSWVLHNEVGMMGISYGGISQLFTAATQPPSLSAISPLSVIDNTQTTLYPGGILNTGFALEWAEERVHDAEAASATSGQEWAYKRVQEGDGTCAANQALHPEAVDLLEKIEENDHYVPEVADPLSPITFVDKIDVPTFMACQWTDEQTGGHCPALVKHFTGTNRKWFTFTNGTHVDSLDPATFNRWYDFLQLYVAKRAPLLASAGDQSRRAADLPGSDGDPRGDAAAGPDPGAADLRAWRWSAFENQKPVRVLFDNGAGGISPGRPYPGFEKSFDELPVPGTQAKAWYLSPGGGLSGEPPAAAGADEFTWDVDALPRTDFSGNTGAGEGGLWTAAPEIRMGAEPAGERRLLLSPSARRQHDGDRGRAPSTSGSAPRPPTSTCRRRSARSRTDGKETFVQNGWVRGSARKLDPVKSTALEPVLSLREADLAPLPPDQFVPVTIPLYYEGHAYRAGSRIRVTIAAPNGTQPIWDFDETVPEGTAQVAIAYGAATPSNLLLPVVPGVSVPTGLPPCPGLRGQPCRAYQAFANQSATP